MSVCFVLEPIIFVMMGSTNCKNQFCSSDLRGICDAM